MLKKSNPEREREIIEELVSSDESLKIQHELFMAEMAFKREMAEARRSSSLTQKDISQMTGMSQQAVSRIERGTGGTIETVIRYLYSMGYTLSIKRQV